MSEIEFELDQVTTKLGKYSNNLEKHGSESVPCWALPCTEIVFSREMMCALAADKHFDRALFNDDRGVLRPMPWTQAFRLDYQKSFEEAVFTIHFSEKTESEFENCKVKIVDLVPQETGIGIGVIQVQIYPDRKQLVMVHEHQGHTVKISLSNAKVAAKKGDKQGDLLEPPAPVEGRTTPVIGAGHIGAGGAADPRVWWQHGVSGEQGNGPRSAIPDGCVEIDPPSGSKSEREQLAHGEPAAPGTMPDVALPPVDDSAEFAEGLAKHVGAARKKGSNVIDGRSERVKHRDRQAGKH